jgi:excisionase family DNA binding protein
MTPEVFAEALVAGAAAIPALGAQSAAGAEGERLLTAEQLEEQTNIPASWYEQAAREQRIPSVRIGRYVRFKFSEIGEHCKSALAAHRRFKSAG